MTSQLWAQLPGQPAYDSKGQKIGDVRRVFLDEATNEPAWATVWAKRFGDREAIVPLAGAKPSNGGLALAVRSERVLEAPTVDPDSEITAEDAMQVSRHYERESAAGKASRYADESRDNESRGNERGQRPSRSERAEMTSYEEKLQVGAETVETGKARMHKSVSSEPVEATVPLRHEKVRVEHLQANDDRGDPDHEFAEQDAEVTVHDQRPKVSKKKVPTETVRLETQATTDEQRVSDEVRREHIDVEENADEPSVQAQPVARRRR